MLIKTDSSRNLLKEELARRLRNNSRYSQRAFARQLGMSPGELSEILRGKRLLSVKSALRIAQALSLSAEETRHLLILIQMEKGRQYGEIPPAEEDASRTNQLTLDMFHVVSDWYCFAILNLADCEGFSFDEEWIARRLGINRMEAKIALERLERIGLIERKNGALSVVSDYVLSPAGIPSEAIRNYHRQVLEKAIDALDTQGLQEREFSGIGIALNPEFLPEIKKEISDFQDRLVAKYSKGRRTEVYHLETAFFRLSRTDETQKTRGEK